mmetsp:Transcript_44734/g.140274  ORF Transcript_44734/g.140274 Transcript_44734/m.140274 type:complete len:83 (+) Transcript_44734:108-356(+)
MSNEEDDGLSGTRRWGPLYSKYYLEYSLPPDDAGHTIADPKALKRQAQAAHEWQPSLDNGHMYDDNGYEGSGSGSGAGSGSR